MPPEIPRFHWRYPCAAPSHPPRLPPPVSSLRNPKAVSSHAIPAALGFPAFHSASFCRLSRKSKTRLPAQYSPAHSPPIFPGSPPDPETTRYFDLLLKSAVNYEIFPSLTEGNPVLIFIRLEEILHYIGIVQWRHFSGLVNLVINLAAVLHRFIKADYLDFRRIEADEVTWCSCSGNFFCAFFYLKARKNLDALNLRQSMLRSSAISYLH